MKLTSSVASLHKEAELKSTVSSPRNVFVAKTARREHMMKVVIDSVYQTASLAGPRWSTAQWIGSTVRWPAVRHRLHGYLVSWCKCNFDCWGESHRSCHLRKGLHLRSPIKMESIPDIFPCQDNTFKMILKGVHKQFLKHRLDLFILETFCLWETCVTRNNLAHFPAQNQFSLSESDDLNFILKLRR